MKLTTALHRAGLPTDGCGHDPEVSGITADSRQVRPRMIFAAIAGNRADGRAFITQALQQGACAIIST